MYFEKSTKTFREVGWVAFSLKKIQFALNFLTEYYFNLEYTAKLYSQNIVKEWETN